jgi:hypothetical protein
MANITRNMNVTRMNRFRMPPTADLAMCGIVYVVVLLVIAAASHGQAVDHEVLYTLAAYKPGTDTEIVSVEPGQKFDVAVIVQDLRPDGTYEPLPGRVLDKPRGVFAAYVNITFDYRRAKIDTVQYGTVYKNGKRGYLTYAGIKELGAFAGLSPLGKYAYEVVRLNCTAKTAGAIEFVPSFGILTRPACDTLVYAAMGIESQRVAVDKIKVSSVKLTVGSPPPAAVPP